MCTVSACLVVLLLTASPVLACGGGNAIAEAMELEIDMVDEALLTAAVSDHERQHILARLAESQRLLRDGAALWLKETERNEETALGGFDKQLEALLKVEGVVKDLSLPIPACYMPRPDRAVAFAR